MSDTTTIGTSVIGTGAAIVAITAVMLRILTTNIARQFEATNKRIDDTNGRINDTNGRIDDTNEQIRETNRRLETLTSEMHHRFDQMTRELADNRERMAKLEGSLEGFVAGQRSPNAA